jgi:hypothetical protein
MNKELTRFEILQMARDLILNEHRDRQANLHNQWLVDNDYSIRNHRLKVPYPVIPPYPTEADIIARAQLLFDFLNNDVKNKETITIISEPVVEQEPVVETQPIAELEPVVEQETTLEVEPEPVVEEPVVEESVVEEPQAVIKEERLLPGVLKKLENIRFKKS